MQHIVSTHTGVPSITLTSTPSRQTFHLLYQLPQSVECARSEHGARQGHNNICMLGVSYSGDMWATVIVLLLDVIRIGKA